MNTLKPKLCVDCKWAKFPLFLSEKFCRCQNPAVALTYDRSGRFFVDGKFNGTPYCFNERWKSHQECPTTFPCGTEGILWEDRS